MQEFPLYLESGPRQRTTMVHVLDLLGCIVKGATSAAAVEASPQGIRRFLAFLQHWDKAIDPQAPFATPVVEHVMQGAWLGYGDPTPGFSWDFQPLTVADQKIYLQRLERMQSGLIQLLQPFTPDQLASVPESGERSILSMLEHITESQGYYLRYLVGKVDGLTEAIHRVQAGPETVFLALEDFWQLINDRLEALTNAERSVQVPHGQVTWTARRAFRRMLEHEWEHWLELTRRFEGGV